MRKVPDAQALGGEAIAERRRRLVAPVRAIATVADGILDRIVHNAHRIELRGDSMRQPRGEKPAGTLRSVESACIKAA